MTPRPTASSATARRRKGKRKQQNPYNGNKPKRRALQVRAANLPDSEFEKTCTKSHPMPEDYIFVPKGDPYVTRHCKARTKDEKRPVYIVYDSKFKHQLGIRIPLAIHTTVLESASSTAAQRASATLLRDQRDNIKARSLLLATFPAIPPKCLERILEHAFLKGSGRVGRISTRTDAKKATLAVEAHIRHEHTGYERLMQEEGTEREEARRRVWGEVRRIRDEWAGKIANARENGEVEEAVEEAVEEIEVIDLT